MRGVGELCTLHRQAERKGGAPPRTVYLPKLTVEALTVLFAEAASPDAPVFRNRDGGWMSLADLRRAWPRPSVIISSAGPSARIPARRWTATPRESSHRKVVGK
ncbi:hypothetical protein [Nocardia inohanensis]|uniref:hypothetical protein n=1 Tax=Nocardia inohanensis TaxID=209246 RepID=UPI00082CBF35